MKKQKVILFGGSFDPVHKGHLIVAREVFDTLSANALVFIPARRSPHKEDFPVSGAHRIEMIRRVIVQNAGFSVSDCELNRPEPSYTLDTIEFFRKSLGPEAVLHWLIGADQLADFDKWYKVRDLVDACHVTVMYRAGYPKPSFEGLTGLLDAGQIAKLEQHIVKTSLVPISSTDIRRRIVKGEDLADLIDASVIDYIRSHQLYGCRG